MMKESALTSEVNQPDITLDFRSLHCPNLLITVIKEIEKAQPGQVLRIMATEPNAPSSIGSWTRQSGHALLDMYQEGADFIFIIQCQAEAINYQLTTINDKQSMKD
jgi:TusA-related sulfurtransferase